MTNGSAQKKLELTILYLFAIGIIKAKSLGIISEYSVTSADCQKPLGMESTAIKHWQISASSSTGKASADKARLNLKKGGWIAEDEDFNAWLQINFTQWNVLITAVATQGLDKRKKWVTKYKLQYWRWKTNVKYYKDPQQSGPFKVINGSLSFLLYSIFILKVRKLPFMVSSLLKAINNRFMI